MTLMGKDNLPHCHENQKDRIDRLILATAQNPGAQQKELCAQAGISVRTAQVWMKQDDTRDYIEQQVNSLLRDNKDLLKLSMQVKREGMQTIFDRETAQPREFESVKDEVNAKQVALRASEQTDQVFGLYKQRIELDANPTGSSADMLAEMAAVLDGSAGGEPGGDRGTLSPAEDGPDLQLPSVPVAAPLPAEPEAEPGGGGGEPER